MRAIFAAVLFFLLPVASGAEQTDQIDVKPAETAFIIRLPSNITTGYKWIITKYDNTLISLTSERYEKPDSRLMGAGGFDVFSFQLIKDVPRPTSTSVTLSYRRPWEKEDLYVKTVVVNFQKMP
ncbi:protease inhibitor I42 family protein [Legionella sp. CNM-4043-24]|uniref:protease inhibitor I42 family protein n=1 Tax=Legionella sp. CNM-4043-24 TaxID=3421646 RepID=UPI00403ABC41